MTRTAGESCGNSSTRWVVDGRTVRGLAIVRRDYNKEKTSARRSHWPMTTRARLGFDRIEFQLEIQPSERGLHARRVGFQHSGEVFEFALDAAREVIGFPNDRFPY
jgi:hypothetical protein